MIDVQTFANVFVVLCYSVFFLGCGLVLGKLAAEFIELIIEDIEVEFNKSDKK